MDYGISNPCPATPAGPIPTHLFLTLINTLMQTKCQLDSQLNNNYPQDYSTNLQDNEEFDFVIIGGGSAGSVVANKLSENEHWKILLLEAGNVPSTTSEIPCLLFSLQETAEDWQYTTEPNENSCLGCIDNKCKWPRGKLFGGTSSINAMLYLRGNKRDYQKWSKTNPNWSYETILENFKNLEKLDENIFVNSTKYGRSGYQHLTKYTSDEPIRDCIINAIKELNYNYSEYEQNIGYYETLMTVNKGQRANSGKSFVGNLKRKNLFVSYKSQVEKFIINNRKIQQIIVNVNQKKIRLKIGKEAILSAGTVNSPKILMLSGIGPAGHLHNLGIPPVLDLPVGKNLQDHVLFFGFFLKINKQDENEEDNDDIKDYFNYFYKQTGKLSEIGITNLVGFINTKNDSNYPNVQFHHVVHGKKDKYLLPTITNVVGFKSDIQKQFLAINNNYKTLHILPTILNPKSLGEIQLKSGNPNEKPKIFPNYFSEKYDREILLESVRFLEKLLETKAFQKFGIELNRISVDECDQYIFKSDDYWLCLIKYLSTTVYHPVGTCKMGPGTDPDSVVDSRLKVHGLDNLRVIDASIMPTITSGNTNGPALVIGHYGAVMVQEDWRNLRDEL